MANTIDLITKYSTKAWDKVYKAESRSAVLDAPNANVQWTGAKTVKIAKFQAGGLMNYYRNNTSDTVKQTANTPFGYQTSSVGLTWEEFTVRMDRAAQYPIEMFDNEETDGLALGAATTEISRTILIPEVDAYTFSTVASYCNADLGNLVSVKATAKDAFSKLNDAFLYFDEHEVPAEDQVIFMSPRYYNYLRNDNTEFSRILMQTDYNKDVKFTFQKIDGRDIIVVPPQRFRTLFTTETTSGAGYGFEDGSEEIAFIVCAKSAVMHVVKYNKVKVLSGDVVLAGGGFDGYMLFARIYHDVFVQDNKRYAIYTAVNGGTDKTTVAAKEEVKTSETAKLPKSA